MVIRSVCVMSIIIGQMLGITGIWKLYTRMDGSLLRYAVKYVCILFIEILCEFNMSEWNYVITHGILFNIKSKNVLQTYIIDCSSLTLYKYGKTSQYTRSNLLCRCVGLNTYRRINDHSANNNEYKLIFGSKLRSSAVGSR